MDPHSPIGKGEWVAREQNHTTVHDNTGLCLFLEAAGADLETLIACTVAATGIVFSVADFAAIGERTWNLERLWNQRAGLSAADDSLPARLLREPLDTGPAAGVTVRLEQMLAAYYQARGWTAEGLPTREKLLELGLTSL
jgi:aldehyde:ferredoxin oxidoreductase